MYEQPSPGRRIGPALIALLVVLAGTAGTFGYLIARRIVSAQTAPANPTTPPASTTPGRTTDPGDPTSPPATDPADRGTFCPAVTARALRDAGLDGELRLVLYIEAKRDGVSNAEVWICRNSDNVLVYQGHVVSGPLDSADNGQNSILLASGVKGSVELDVTGYVAVNPNRNTTTEYHVSREALVVVNKPSNNENRYAVVRVVPP